MSLGLIFYICLLIWLIGGFAINRPAGWALGGSVLEFLLFLTLGWQIFGAPIKG